ncbi:Serine phosphatase RsbU, regulator of sigma subunit [Streptomyces zhaozhouensis]|uniref:Serine phosphatase RsbU, regulator of sigma subunit n=1 Tax=Streptomyces zhaozhouensis TaxID=1300267 RepID=A0A286E0J5_9ACTN|nr:SpoIIE family protein phosphatase [Streptomyces zhaozhouensis]SOD64395.1 Serine phosphatase RsbU, regulator of sigma subunit [Streptomyces zhaozhouensis]
MTEPEIDYRAAFRAAPTPLALLTTELRFVDVTDAYLEVAGRPREQVIGRLAYEAFPDQPDSERPSGVRRLRQSMERVLATRRRDVMAVQRYDVEPEEGAGRWEERYFSIVNAPVLGPDGEVRLLLNRLEEVTRLVRTKGGGAGGGRDGARGRDGKRGGGRGREDRRPTAGGARLESDLLARADELQHTNERLREAHSRERHVAMELQQAMLPTPDLLAPRDAAVRYQPASATMNVCGDWYDLIDVDALHSSVVVGDVVGHGLEAAGVMGQLRSALSALARAATPPAEALNILDLYSRSVPGAESTTAVKIHVDWSASRLVYSSAGHLPPLLARLDGTVELLDRATNPPLGLLPEGGGTIEDSVAFEPGDVLVVYTDGLVERRDEDIDRGLARLADSLASHRTAPAEELAEALLADLLPPEGTEDDTVLVVLRLDRDDTG